MIAGLLQDRTQIALERLNEAILQESTQADLARPLENYDITDAQVTLLQAVALSVDDGILDKAGLTLAGMKVTVGSKANGNTYLRIVQSEEENREITRNGLK